MAMPQIARGTFLPGHIAVQPIDRELRISHDAHRYVLSDSSPANYAFLH